MKDISKYYKDLYGDRYDKDDMDRRYESLLKRHEELFGVKEGDTMLSLKKLSPTRLIKNDFYAQVQEAEDRGASKEELTELLGRGRARLGIFDGDLSAGELEIGQGVSLIEDLPSAADIVRSMMDGYRRAVAGMQVL